MKKQTVKSIENTKIKKAADDAQSWITFRFYSIKIINLRFKCESFALSTIQTAVVTCEILISRKFQQQNWLALENNTTYF